MDKFIPPSPELVDFYTKTSRILIVFATFSFIIGVVVVRKASTPHMGTYKWLLLREFAWNFAFDVCLCLWQPFPLFPYQCAYSVGIMQNSTAEQSRFALKIAIFCMIAKAMSLYSSILNRYVASLPVSEYGKIHRYLNGKDTMRILGISTFIFQMAFMLAIKLVDKDQVTLKAQLASNNSNLAILFEKEPSTFCYSMDTFAAVVYFGIFVFALSIFVLCPYFLLKMYIAINDNLAHFSSETLRLQRMLFVSVVCQCVCGFLLLVIPNTFVFFCITFGIQDVYVEATMSMIAISLHSVIDTLLLFYCIRPYRRYILNNLFCCFWRMKRGCSKRVGSQGDVFTINNRRSESNIYLYHSNKVY